MGEPAARLNDMHECPQIDPGPIPHRGMQIVAVGCPTVLIGGQIAARVSDFCLCNGPLDPIVKGSSGVLIGGKPAARKGDPTGHHGKITQGCSTVLIGEKQKGSEDDDDDAQADALDNAAQNGMPFCAICQGG
jgi:uncharacterized Zn-binding protein involved in type VI secretion